MLSLSKDIADNQGVLIGKGGGVTIVLIGVMLSICGGMEVTLTVSKVGDDDALGDVVVAVIGKADVGVILSIYDGMEVVLTVSKVYDVVALSVRLVDVIYIHDGS